MSPQRILLLGATGVFGRLIAADLLVRTRAEVVCASRRGIGPEGWIPGSEGRAHDYRMDASDEAAVRKAIQHWEPRIVIHAAGPWYNIGDAPLQAAVAEKVAYVDMCSRSELFVHLRDRYDKPAREAQVPCFVGASTAGGLTGTLTRLIKAHMSQVDKVRTALCVHNFSWGAAAVSDALRAAGSSLPPGKAGTSAQKAFFPPLGLRTVRLADSLDYIEGNPDAVLDVEHRFGLDGFLPGLGIRIAEVLSSRGVPLWKLGGLLGRLAGVLGGARTEGGLLHQSFGRDKEGRPGVWELHLHRPYGNVRVPGMLCAVAAARLLDNQPFAVGVLHPASWLEPETLVEELKARAVELHSRFVPEGVEGVQWTQW